MSLMTELMLSNIQIKLKEKGMLKKELEEKCGVRVGHIGRKDSRYTIELVCEIANILGVTPGELLFLDFRNNTNNLKKLIAYLDKLIKETEQGRLEWQTCSDLMDVIYTAEDPLCGDEPWLYKRKFDDNFGKQGQLLDVMYVSRGFGREFRLMKARVDGIEGWELYSLPVNEQKMVSGDAVGIYSTFSQSCEIITHKIYDLIQAILMSGQDMYMSYDAKEEVSMFLRDETREIEVLKS